MITGVVGGRSIDRCTQNKMMCMKLARVKTVLFTRQLPNKMRYFLISFLLTEFTLRMYAPGCSGLTSTDLLLTFL
jgi:hypothetical protein